MKRLLITTRYYCSEKRVRADLNCSTCHNVPGREPTLLEVGFNAGHSVCLMMWLGWSKWVTVADPGAQTQLVTLHCSYIICVLWTTFKGKLLLKPQCLYCLLHPTSASKHKAASRRVAGHFCFRRLLYDAIKDFVLETSTIHNHLLPGLSLRDLPFYYVLMAPY